MRTSKWLLALAAGWTALGTGAALADRFDGTLNAQWGDPRPGASGGEVRFNVTLPDGKTYKLFVNPADQGLAMAAFGKRVSIDGKRITDANGQSGIQADHISASNGPVQHATETRRVIFLLLKFKDDAQEPHEKSWYLHLTNPKKGNDDLKIPATVNGFFDKT